MTRREAVAVVLGLASWIVGAIATLSLAEARAARRAARRADPATCIHEFVIPAGTHEAATVRLEFVLGSVRKDGHCQLKRMTIREAKS